MSLPSGTPNIYPTKVITADDYNRTAWLVNKVWADITDIPTWVETPTPPRKAWEGPILPNPKEYFAYDLGNTGIGNREHADVIAFENSISSSQRTFTLNPVPADHDMVVVYLGTSIDTALTIPSNSGVWRIVENTLELLGNNYDTPEQQNLSFNGKTLIVYNRETHTFGWGQGRFLVGGVSSGAVAYVQEGNLITATHMNALINRVNVMLRHIGSGLNVGRMNPGELILAEHANEIRNLIINNVINEPNNTHMTMDIENIASSSTTVLHTRQLDWGYTQSDTIADNQRPTSKILAATRYKFKDYNEARYFFNAGSELRLSVSIDDSDDIGTQYWRTMIDELGTVRMDWETVESSNSYGVSRDIGFYALSQNYQLVYTAYGSGTGSSYAGYGGYGGYGGYFDPAKERIEIMSRYVDKNSQFYEIDPNNDCAVYIDIQVAMISESYNVPIIGSTQLLMYFVAADDFTSHVSYSTHKPYDMEALDNADELAQVDFDSVNDQYNG